MKCPYCGSYEKKILIRDPWVYNGYHVEKFKCANCQNKFNFYQAEGRESFTVPKTLNE